MQLVSDAFSKVRGVNPSFLGLTHGFWGADKVLDAVEAAERSTLAATSNVVSGAVSKR